MLAPSFIPLLLSAALAGAAEQLGSDDWATRERASATMAALGPLAAPVLDRAAASADAEVKWRAESLQARLKVSRVDRLTAAALAGLSREGFHEWPWIDSLPQDYPDRLVVVNRYLGQAREAGFAADAPYWPAYRAATQRFIHDLFEAGRKEADVEALLRRMIDGDAAQCRANRTWHWAGRVAP